MSFQKKNSTSTVQRYLLKHAKKVSGSSDLPLPHKACRLCIVIPAMAESTLIESVFDSLLQGSLQLHAAEIIVIVNNPADAPGTVLEDNQTTLKLIANRPLGVLPIHVVDCTSPGRSFSPGHAGVGMARRVGMDLALRRLAQNDHDHDGIIACLDGDSPVAPGYIDQLLNTFQPEYAPLAGLCNYAHVMPDQGNQTDAMLQYEIWLRYFELGFHLARSNFTANPIGSCIAVSVRGYAAADGMVLRDAGEDFYFWQKLVKVSKPRQLLRLKNVVVYPSSRISNRMPFGTSRALYRIVHEKSDIYHRVDRAGAFLVLREFINAVPVYFENPDAILQVSDLCLRQFLRTENALKAVRQMKKTYPTQDHFERAFMQWFDGLRSIRFIHVYTATHGAQPLFEALTELLQTENYPIPKIDEKQPPVEKQRIWLETMRAYSYPDWF